MIINENKEALICSECGGNIANGEEYIEVDNNIVCSGCYDDNYINCYHCDNIIKLSDNDYVELQDTNEIVCQDCAERYYYHCNDCGEYYANNDEGLYDYEDNFICSNCKDNYYYCDNCGDYFYEDDIQYDEASDRCYCASCYEELHNITSRVLNYHEFSDWQLFKSSSESVPPFYLGCELEVENTERHSESEAVQFITSHLNAICSHDGSLNNGFEIVTHPQSFKYILENQEQFKKVFEQLQKWGFKSHDTQTCGLHIHVTRPSNEDIIDKIWLVMETYKEELIKISRRDYDRLTRWASFLSDKGISDKESKALYYIKKAKGNFNRYMALNIQTEGKPTIEFRLFKGTLNFNTFMATLELVNNIVTLCSNDKINVTSINWDKITSTPYLKEYCEKHNIKSNKKIKDNSLAILKQENKKKAIIHKIEKLVTNEAIEYYQHYVNRINKKNDSLTLLKACGDILNNTSALEKIHYTLKRLRDYQANGNYNLYYVRSDINDLNYYCVISLETYNTIEELLKEVE